MEPIASPLPARPSALLRRSSLPRRRLLSAQRGSPSQPCAASALCLRRRRRTKPSLFPGRFSSSSSSQSDSLGPASPPPPTPLPPPPPREGAKPLPLVISLAGGLTVCFLVPRPAEVTPQAWQLLAIFLSTITGLVLSPLPIGAWAFLCLTASVATKTLTFSAAFDAFENEVIWLIVISFFFARGFVKTGLGDRIATYFVKWLGKSTLGLSYGLTISEVFIAPAMPSTTEGAGGVFLPIIQSLSLSAGSKPRDGSACRLGSYLVMSQFQVRILCFLAFFKGNLCFIVTSISKRIGFYFSYLPDCLSLHVVLHM
ncbi:hypothetical protein Cni_G04947 [Canna indica]|uniref:Uncharacterized protein n=1 Tax=Canna indica TaxID=4628 RepID=A0AAQ3Q2P3_9LILI|nr:hypothetical protein Cni_G04947 [Canna indica]